MRKKHVKKTASKKIIIKEEHAGRRIDNYLLRYFDKIPKSRIYQMLRRGEIRVNKGRVKQTYRLITGDTVRLPPVYENEYADNKSFLDHTLKEVLNKSIIYEDEGILIINKPAGVVVHSGSGQQQGLIESMRSVCKEYETLELVHRLDKDTSGCLILAKAIPILRQLHDLIKNDRIDKLYCALLAGQIHKRKWTIDRRLRKNTLVSGKRIVTIDEMGKDAITVFFRERLFKNATLVRIQLMTGRTHQIRVHSAAIAGHHPVIGDRKYGDRVVNQRFRSLGLKRLFLHASSLKFKSPINQQVLSIEAPLPQALSVLLDKINVHS